MLVLVVPVLRFARGRCPFPPADLCASLAGVVCSHWWTFAIPSRLLPVPAGGPLHFPRVRFRFPLADLCIQSRSLPVPTGGPLVALCCSHWRTCFVFVLLFEARHLNNRFVTFTSHVIMLSRSLTQLQWASGFIFFPVL